MMRARIWPLRQPVADVEGIESRFPPGSRSGEGSDSLRVFLEAARNARPPAALPLTSRERRRNTRGDD